jgi:hypothetical protein
MSLVRHKWHPPQSLFYFGNVGRAVAREVSVPSPLYALICDYAYPANKINSIIVAAAIAEHNSPRASL